MRRFALVLTPILAIVAIWIASRISAMRSGEQPPKQLAIVAQQSSARPQQGLEQGSGAANRISGAIPEILEQPGKDVSASQPDQPSTKLAPVDVNSSVESAWALEYQGLSPAELQVAADALDIRMITLQSQAAVERASRGIYDVIASGEITSKDVGTKELAVYQMGPNNELRRVTFPELEYPELYAMTAKSEWLKKYALLAALNEHKK
jgi:hypothetical protein